MSDETAFQACSRALRDYVLIETGKDMSEELQSVLNLDEILKSLRKLVEEGHGTSQVKEKLSDMASEVKGDYIDRLTRTIFLQSQAEKVDQPSKELPKEIQPVVKRLKLFIKRACHAKEDVDNIMKVIQETINERMETLPSCSERDLKPIKMKMLELDTELKIWGNLLNQTENVLCDFDKDIKAYKARESQRTRFTIACTFAIIGLTGGTAAIGLGLGGILGAGIALNASAAGASIGGGATVSAFSASFLGYKMKKNVQYEKEEKALNTKLQEFKTKIEGIKLDYQERSIRREGLRKKIKFTERITF